MTADVPPSFGISASAVHDPLIMKRDDKQMFSKKRKRAVIAVLTAGMLLVSSVLSLSARFGWEFPTWESVFAFAGLSEHGESAVEPGMTAEFLDVGQGSSALIYGRDFSILIDTGEREYGERLLSRLKALRIEKLDFLIITHPHTDHMGAAAQLLGRIAVGEVLMPEIREALIPTAASYETFLLAVKENGAKASYARTGDIFTAGDASVRVIAPSAAGNDLNDLSLTLRVSYGETAVVVTGDAPEKAELQMVESGADMRAEILVCGHHGSKFSTAIPFLKAVSPSYAVISCGKNNSYGHPNAETLRRLEAQNVAIYRTDLLGTVVFQSDGKKFVPVTKL